MSDEYPTSATTTKVMGLSSLDQMMVRGIIRFLLCFKVDDPESLYPAISILQRGLTSLVQQTPFLAGNVQVTNDNARNQVELHYGNFNDLALGYKNFVGQMPSFSELDKQSFPLAMLPSDMLSPLPDRLVGPTQPVLAMQANIIDGGIILCVCAHHNVVDGVGFSILMEAFAAHCKQISSGIDQRLRKYELLQLESLSRSTHFEDMIASEPESTHDYPEYHALDPLSQPSSSQSERPPSTARLFRFSAASLQELKNAASVCLPESEFVSTSDALGALIWRSITQARFQTGKLVKEQLCSLCIPMDIRKHMTEYLPPLYLGNAVISTIATRDVENVIDEHVVLTDLARAAREAIAKVDKQYIVGLLQHTANFEGDLNTMKPNMRCYHGPDINFTSWSGFPMYELDFGKYLGRIEYFRCPWRAIDGCIKVLPKCRDGAVEVIVELENESMEALLNDNNWMAWMDQVLE